MSGPAQVQSTKWADCTHCDRRIPAPSPPATDGDAEAALTWAICASAGGGGENICNPRKCCGQEANAIMQSLHDRGWTVAPWQSPAETENWRRYAALEIVRQAVADLDHYGYISGVTTEKMKKLTSTDQP